MPAPISCSYDYSSDRQFALFDLGPDLRSLRAAREDLLSAKRSQNTKKAYGHAWGVFLKWSRVHGLQPLPASEETISLFVTWCIHERKFRLGTVGIILSAIAAEHAALGHPSPVTPGVRGLFRSARRRVREKRRCKAAMAPDLLRRLVTSLPASAIGIRDHAMFVLTFASGWRRSEVTSLDVEDVTLTPRAVELRLGASKADQHGRGRVVVLPRAKHAETCPVRVLRTWLQERGDDPGPLFCWVRNGQIDANLRIKGDVLAKRLRAAIGEVGEDPRPYAAHSLRAGMVTASAENGADVLAIMQRTGHRSVATVLRYVRPAQAFRRDPLAGVL